MKNFFLFLYFFFRNLFIKRFKYIRLTPNYFGKIYYYDKIKKKVFQIFCQGKIDSNTANEIFTNHCYDLSFLKRFHELKKKYHSIIKNGYTPLIIDCGSNIGLSTRYFAELFEEAKIISIEPDLQNFNLLKKNCKEYNNIVFLNSAIGSEKGFVEIINSDESNNSFITNISNNSKSIKLLPINEILNQHPSCLPFIVKIDIEGFENNLFEKNTEWVCKTLLIIIEPHDWLFSKKNSFKNFLKVISKEDRDFVIKGENVYSISN